MILWWCSEVLDLNEVKKVHVIFMSVSASVHIFFAFFFHESYFYAEKGII